MRVEQSSKHAGGATVSQVSTAAGATVKAGEIHRTQKSRNVDPMQRLPPPGSADSMNATKHGLTVQGAHSSAGAQGGETGGGRWLVAGGW
jgi:hypothetical protein